MTNRQTALITGASGGIGLDLARLFAQDDYDLFLVARNEERLRQVAAELERDHLIKATVIAADLARPEAPQTILDATQNVEIDALVNNAGFGLVGPFHQVDMNRQLDMVQVNIAAPTHLTRLLLPRMVARNSGHILNVASTAAFQPGPLMAVYYASKAYLLSFSEALAEELRGTNVKVTALCPGPTATGFAEAAEMTKLRLFSMLRPMSSQKVAEKGYAAMKRGQRVVVTGAINNIGVQSVRFTPRIVMTKIARMLQES